MKITKNKYNTESFIKICEEIHNKEYNYDKLIYLDINTKIIITCVKHGDFKQSPNNHIHGQGCPICGKSKSKKNSTTDEFINKAKIIHGNKYDYSKVKYSDSKTKVKIICLEHGEFEQIPSGHLRGKGCVKCGKKSAKEKLSNSVGFLVEKAGEVHNNKYDYSSVNYVNAHTKIIIKCPTHGEFTQLPYDHLSGHGCNKCASSISSYEVEINEFINSLDVSTITSSMSIIKPQQLDIFIPLHKIAIEFNGLYWHSDNFIDKNYHLNKTKACEDIGIQLIHIFEDEWVNKKDVVKSRLRNLLGVTEYKIYGRKCSIKEITNNISRIFLDKNHLQGFTNSTVKLGLFHEEELVSVMLFNKPRIGIGQDYDGYELTRFASKLNTSVIGGADKLLKYFVKNTKPKKIVSYADKRWSNGDLYEKLGFKLTHENKPNYWYVLGKTRKHRFNYRKNALKEKGIDITNKTEHEIMLNLGIYRIYDCGTLSYTLDLRFTYP